MGEGPDSARRPGIRKRIRLGLSHGGIPATSSEGRLKTSRIGTGKKVPNTLELRRTVFLNPDFHF